MLILLNQGVDTLQPHTDAILISVVTIYRACVSIKAAFFTLEQSTGKDHSLWNVLLTNFSEANSSTNLKAHELPLWKQLNPE